MEHYAKLEETVQDLSSRLLEIKAMAVKQPYYYSPPVDVYLYDSSNTEKNGLLTALSDRMSQNPSFNQRYGKVNFIVGLPTKKEFKRANGKSLYMYDLNLDLRSGQIISLLAA